jgi:hypothetical protein
VRPRRLPPQSGPLGAIARGAQILRCEASLVSLARTGEAGGERRGARAPAFRWCTGRGPEPTPRAAVASMGCAATQSSSWRKVCHARGSSPWAMIQPSASSGSSGRTMKK